MIKIEDFDLDNIFIDEKSYENILVYNISYKNLIAAKPLRYRFDKIDGFIIVYDETKCLVLFRSEKYDSIYNRIRYLVSVKSGITYVISYNYAKIKVDLYNSLPLEKTIIFHNVIILIKGTLSGLRQFLASESPLKMMKSAFYFTLKALFVFNISFCLDFLVMYQSGLIKKIRSISNFMTLQPG